MRTESRSRLALLTCVLVGAACAEPIAPRESRGDRPTVAFRADHVLGGSALHRSYDERLLAVAQRAPGFGGVYVGEAGEVVILLQDARQLATAIAALASDAPDAVDATAPVRVRQADFGWDQLYGWNLALIGGFGEGVISIDIDERRNRIRLGIADDTHRNAVQAFVARAGVASGAVLIERVARFEPTATLRDHLTRPMSSGVRIANDNGGTCTMNVRVMQDYYQHFLTNSHCTLVQGGAGEATQFYQPSVSTANLVGIEQKDPVYFTQAQDPQCPAGFRCRYSDAALIRIPDGQDILNHQEIFRTTQRGAVGNVTIAESCYIGCTLEDIRVEARGGRRAPGNVVDKVGQTSGWTYGPVQTNCESIQQGSSDIVLICQSTAAASAGPGDSGSPVFQYRTEFGNHYATFDGILWGGTTSGPPLFAYSTLDQVEAELGTLCVIAGGAGC